ncbi:MAG: ribosomal protein S18-alanine N-acetyltransferase [Clostridiaceae bacterium]
MSNITIRMAEIEDSEMIYEVSSKSFNTSWSLHAIKEEFYNLKTIYLVAEDDGKIIGFGGFWLILDQGDITNIAVIPEYRNQKVGSLILENLIKEAKIRKATSMTLEVRGSNTNAIHLYEKFSFKNDGIRKSYYRDNGEDAIIMWNTSL